MTLQAIARRSLGALPLPREPGRHAVNAAYVVSAAVAVWLLYVMVRVAQHVSAWPF